MLCGPSGQKRRMHTCTKSWFPKPPLSPPLKMCWDLDEKLLVYEQHLRKSHLLNLKQSFLVLFYVFPTLLIEKPPNSLITLLLTFKGLKVLGFSTTLGGLGKNCFQHYCSYEHTLSGSVFMCIEVLWSITFKLSFPFQVTTRTWVIWGPGSGVRDQAWGLWSPAEYENLTESFCQFWASCQDPGNVFPQPGLTQKVWVNKSDVRAATWKEEGRYINIYIYIYIKSGWWSGQKGRTNLWLWGRFLP